MSKARQRARATREAEKANARAKAAKAAERKAKLERVTPHLPEVPKRQPVYRQRRFPPLPWRFKLALTILWVAVVLLVLFTVDEWTGRIGLIVVATMAVPLVVILVTDPARRYR